MKQEMEKQIIWNEETNQTSLVTKTENGMLVEPLTAEQAALEHSKIYGY